MIKNKTLKKTRRGISLLVVFLLLVVALPSAFAPEDYGYTLSTYVVTIGDQGIFDRHVFGLLRGDTMRFQNSDDQPHTLMRVHGDKGQASINLPAGASHQINFPDPTIADLIYAVDREANPQRITIRVSPLTIPNAPEGKTRTAVLIRDNKFFPAELTITRGDGLVFLNLDHVSHRIFSGLAVGRSRELRPFSEFPRSMSEIFFIIKQGGTFRLDDEDTGPTFTFSLVQADTLFPKLLAFIKTKATGLIRTLTRLFRPPEPLSEDDLSKIPFLRSFDKFYLAQNGDKSIIGFTQSRDLRGPNAKMHVYYKNIDFDICATLAEFRRLHTINVADITCVHRGDQYEVTASPVVYDQYWQDFTSKIRLNNPP